MSDADALQPLYLDGPNGALFAAWHRPVETKRGTVLYLPPFAEEMNRSRRTIAALGRAMAARSLGLFVLDLHGTGDSAGGFEDARWNGWLADAAAAIRHIESEGERVIGTLGLRTGALLALATAKAAGLERVLLCQPVESGRTYLTGLLRSRVAAAQSGDGPRVTMAGLRAMLAAGTPIELLGYPLAPELFAGLEAADLAEIGAGYSGQVDWLHLTTRPDEALPQRSADAVARLRDGIAGPFSCRTIEAPSFWLLEETPVADQFVIETVETLLSPGKRAAA